MCTRVSLPYREVRLVADEHDGHIRVRVLPCILEPIREVIEGFPASDIVHEQRARGASVVASRDGSERLLACGVPDLQFDLLGVDGDHSCAELDADGEVMHRLEALVREL